MASWVQRRRTRCGPPRSRPPRSRPPRSRPPRSRPPRSCPPCPCSVITLSRSRSCSRSHLLRRRGRRGRRSGCCAAYSSPKEGRCVAIQPECNADPHLAPHTFCLPAHLPVCPYPHPHPHPAPRTPHPAPRTPHPHPVSLPRLLNPAARPPETCHHPGPDAHPVRVPHHRRDHARSRLHRRRCVRCNSPPSLLPSPPRPFPPSPLAFQPLPRPFAHSPILPFATSATAHHNRAPPWLSPHVSSIKGTRKSVRSPLRPRLRAGHNHAYPRLQPYVS